MNTLIAYSALLVHDLLEVAGGWAYDLASWADETAVHFYKVALNHVDPSKIKRHPNNLIEFKQLDHDS